MKKFPRNPCLGHRPTKYGEPQPYEWLTYKETGELVDAVASGAMALGLNGLGRVGVYGINSPEWMIAMQVLTWRCSTTAADLPYGNEQEMSIIWQARSDGMLESCT